MPYLITHAPSCACSDRAPHTCVSAKDVACWLWGRDVTQHTVWQGECPYRFRCTNVAFVELILEDCPVARMRPFLPCALYAGTEILVTIGDVPQSDSCTVVQKILVREISIMEWLDHIYKGTPLTLFARVTVV